MTKSNRDFLSNQGDIILRLMIPNGQVSNSFEILSTSTLSASSGTSDQNWISYAHDKVKQRPFQQSRGCSKINDLMWPVFELIWDISSMSALSASFRKTGSKQRLFQQSRWWNSKIMNQSGQISKSFKISSMSTLSASFMSIWSKLKELWGWQTFSHCTRVLQKVLSLGSDYFSATFYQTYFYYKPSKYSPFTETHFCNLFTQARKADK